MKGIVLRVFLALGLFVTLPIIPIFLFFYKVIEGPILLMRWIINGK